MIYLITVHNHEKELANIVKPEQLSTKLWKSILNLTKHKTILYSTELFHALQAKPIENRVNLMFSPSNATAHKIPNVLINNNLKDIVNTFKDSSDDVYVICSNRTILELFAKDADFIIDYTTEEMECTNVSIFDSVNFADYTLLKMTESEDFIIRYFVREKTNFIGY